MQSRYTTTTATATTITTRDMFFLVLGRQSKLFLKSVENNIAFSLMELTSGS
jgi:hypothetical protein